MNKFLPILLIALLLAFQSNGQESRGPGPQEPTGKLVKLYPNPATTYVTFDLQKNYQKGMTITVFSFLGKKMAESQNVSEKTNIVLTDFNRGMYVYHVTDANGKLVDTGKFQVSR